MAAQDPQAPAGTPRVGEVLAGKYRVERVLGVGGMGAVLAAMHLQLEERVAIKVLHPEIAGNADLVTRFVREGRAAIKIRSEHAVKIFDVGTLDSGAPYLVMEHLEGEDLAQALERGPLPVAVAVEFVLQACEAIAEAHALGIVHRDLKPANLFVTHRVDGTPLVKVLDFGISKHTQGGEALQMTRTQAVMGSPRYMSPEQMRSTRSVDARADVWALGTIVYELLAGAPAFNADTMTELCAQILQDAPPPLGARRPDLPPGFDAVLARALAKSPDDRFANLAQLAAALAPFGGPAARASAERIARVLRAPASPSLPPPSGMPSVPPPTFRDGQVPTQTPSGASAVPPGWGSATGSGASSRGGGGVWLLVGGVAAALLLLVAVGVGVAWYARSRAAAGPAADPRADAGAAESAPTALRGGPVDAGVGSASLAEARDAAPGGAPARPSASVASTVTGPPRGTVRQGAPPVPPTPATPTVNVQVPPIPQVNPFEGRH